MSRRKTSALVVFITLALIAVSTSVGTLDAPDGSLDVPSAQGAPVSRPDAIGLLDNLENRFTENRGQLGGTGGEFYARGDPLSVILGTGWMAYDIQDEEGRTFVRMTFPGADPVVPRGTDALDGRTSFFRGSDPEGWVSEARSFRSVVYEDLWDGIDLVYRFSGDLLKYDLVVAPGARVPDIAIRFEGTSGLSIDRASGDLLVGTHSRPVRDMAPTAEQVILGERTEIGVGFAMADETTVTFAVGDFDTRAPLVIDPGLVFGTYVGGTGPEYKVRGAVDEDGYVYVAGSTESFDFPTTPGAYKGAMVRYGTDAFVSKLSADGSSLVYSTFIGSDSEGMFGIDYCYDMTIDAEGCAYITGCAHIGYPTTSGAYSNKTNGIVDAFLTKLSKDGASLEYSTFFGGSGLDCAQTIAVDSQGCAWIAGYTWSTIPFSEDAYDTTPNGECDVFLVKFNADGTDFAHSTLYGGDQLDEVMDLALDDDGSPYIAGRTLSSDLPTLANAYDRSYHGDDDIMMVKFKSNLSDIEYASYIGTPYSEYGQAIAVDDEGRAVLTGYTEGATFPTTEGAYNRTFFGSSGLSTVSFCLRMNQQGSALDFSTFISLGTGHSLFLEEGSILFALTTFGGHLPISPDAYDDDPLDVDNAGLVRMDENGTRILYATYIGGDGASYIYSLDMDSRGIITLIGGTYDPNCDTSMGSYSQTLMGSSEVYIARLDLSKPRFLEDTSDTTATTGDEFRFRVRALDEMGIANVSVEYWFGGDATHTTASLANETAGAEDGNWTTSVIVPSDTVGPMLYAFHACDTAGNLNVTSIVQVNVTDNDPPEFLSIYSDPAATTASAFMVRVQVSDNIGVRSVHVNWSEAGLTGSTKLYSRGVDAGGNGSYEAAVSVYYFATGNLTYYFVLEDTSGNLNVTGEYVREILDDDAPKMFQDNTRQVAYTGDPFKFTVIVTDNIGVAEVFVLYWFEGDASPTNVTMAPTTNPMVFEYEGLVIPVDSTRPFRYSYAIVDTSGNWATTGQVNVTVLDDDAPTLGPDHTSSDCVKGLGQTFTTEARDNIGVATVNLTYWFGAGERTNLTMSGPEAYSATIAVPRHPEGDLHYVFVATDLAGNVFKGPEGVLHPRNLPPVIEYEGPWTITEGVESRLNLTPFIGDGNDAVADLAFGCAGASIYRNGTFTLVALRDAWVPDHVVEVSVSDGEDTAYLNVTVHVVNVNDPIAVTSLPPRVAAVGQPYAYAVTWADEDPMDTITFELDLAPEGMAVSPQGVVTWTPDRRQHDWQWVLLEVSDGTVTVVQGWPIFVRVPGVEPGNRPPVPSPDVPRGAARGHHLSWQWVVADPDGDVLRYYIELGPEGATIGNMTGVIEWDVPVSFPATVAFRLNVTDGSHVVPFSFTVRVRDSPNRPPAISGLPPELKVRKDLELDLSPFMTDPDDPKANLTWRVEGGNSSLFSMTLVNDKLIIKPVKGARGSANVTLTLEDPSGDLATEGLEVNVEPPAVRSEGPSYLWIAVIVVVAVVVLVAVVAMRGRGARGGG